MDGIRTPPFLIWLFILNVVKAESAKAKKLSNLENVHIYHALLQK
jgi:hypothetical protein